MGATTLIPTSAPDDSRSTAAISHPGSETDATVALRVADTLLRQASGKGGPIFTGALAGLVAAALAMAWHLSSEDRSLERRFDEQDRRIDRVEAQQDRILLNVEAIAAKVGATTVPMTVESRR